MQNWKRTVLSLAALAAATASPAAPNHRITGIKWDVVPGVGVCQLESRIFGGQFADKVIVAGTPGVSPLREIGVNPLIEPKPGKMFTVAYSVNGEPAKQGKLLPRRKDPRAPLFVRMDPIEQIRVLNGEPLLLGFVNGEVVQVETDGIEASAKALEACNNAAMSKALGMPIDLSVIGPATLATYTGLRGIFTPDDYPDEALTKGVVGRVTFLAGIGAAGKVAACVTLESSGSEALDKRVCEIIKRRAKFAPRTDKSGAPVNSAMINSIGFWVQDEEDEGMPNRLGLGI